MHLVDVAAGLVTIDFAASLDGAEGADETPDDALPPRFDRLAAVVALRQSRYCPSDTLAGYAAVEFVAALGAGPGEIAQQVASWVFERLAYAPGSSGPLDTALDTLAAGSGVCRDFAHLTITICRALGVPARLISVYAPGISPMDFHAVVEVLTPIGWAVVDPTRLAPRSALVRIATGRDAADTAFATTLRGGAELIAATVFASSDGHLPADDHAAPVVLA
jgi:transglutaminase-like putative cysteine protease